MQDPSIETIVEKTPLSVEYLSRLLGTSEESDCSGRNDTSGYESEDPRRFHCLSQTPNLKTRGLIEDVADKVDSAEITECLENGNGGKVFSSFSSIIDGGGGVAGCGSIALMVPPFAVRKPTEFNGQLGALLAGMPDLEIPDYHYLLSPVLSLAPHDVEFQQKVAIRFPVSAVVNGWFLRLICCPVDGDRWEAIVDILVPHSMSASSLKITAHGDALYDVDSGLIYVDHFCYKCWLGIPLRHNVKKRIWCTLFGRPLGSAGNWEIIVRCFDPYIEVYNRVADMMAEYGAEPLIDAPEPLEIGRNGVVCIALEQGNFPWLLDGGEEKFSVKASSTFWERPPETLLGYRCKFVVRPNKGTDYVRVLVSVSYTSSHSNCTKRKSQSLLLDGTAPVCGRGSRHRGGRGSSHSSVYNVTCCNEVVIDSESQFTHYHTVSQPGASPTSNMSRLQTNGVGSVDGDTVDRLPVNNVQSDSTTADSNIPVLPIPPSTKNCTWPECGQQESVLLLSFPRGGITAPSKCTIDYLSCHDSANTRTTEGARVTDWLVETWKPSWPYPDKVNVLISDESGHAVGHCLISLGASQLPVTHSAIVTVIDAPDTDTDSDEEDGATNKSLCSSTSHLDAAETDDSEKSSPTKSPRIARAADLDCGSETGGLLLKLVSQKKLSSEQAIIMALECHPSSTTESSRELAKDLVRRGYISSEDAIDVMWDLLRSPVSKNSFEFRVQKNDGGSNRARSLPSIFRRRTRNASETEARSQSYSRRWSDSSSQDVVQHPDMLRKVRRRRTEDDSEEIRDRLFSVRSNESTTDSVGAESANRVSVMSEVLTQRQSALVANDEKLASVPE